MSITAVTLASLYGSVLIPIERVREEYFPHLSRRVFLRRLSDGSIALPVTRSDTSRKASLSVHVADLGQYIDRRRDLARKEMSLMATLGGRRD